MLLRHPTGGRRESAGAANQDHDEGPALARLYQGTSCWRFTRPAAAPPLHPPQWLSAPRGAAFMWVAPAHKARVRPLIVSHGHGSGYTSEFLWDGG